MLCGDASAEGAFVGRGVWGGFKANGWGAGDDAFAVGEFVFDAAQVRLDVEGLDAGFFAGFAQNSGFDLFAGFDGACRELNARAGMFEDEDFALTLLLPGDEGGDFVNGVGHGIHREIVYNRAGFK